MIKRQSVRWLAASLLAVPGILFTQEAPTSVPSDPFQQHVPGVELKEQSVVDGIAILSQKTGLPVSVEFPLGVTISAPAPSLKTLTANVRPGTVSEVLNRLCQLDGTFIWIRSGNMTNVLPRALANDPSYFLNRRIDELTFQEVRDAEAAVFKTAEQLPGPKEQIAVLQSGLSLNFARPWSTRRKGVTVREVFDGIAQQLGPTYGWQFSGANDFRVITFHEGILPKPPREISNH